MSRRGVFGASIKYEDELQEQVSSTKVKDPDSGQRGGNEQVFLHTV